jgi:hypothetical protein
MLISGPADALLVVSRVVSTFSLVCCALVIASFGIFAFGQANGASKTQVAELKQPGSTSSGQTQTSARAVAQPRRFIDAANRLLTAPFRSFFQNDSQWAAKIASTLLALLAYGLGLGYLARYSRL